MAKHSYTWSEFHVLLLDFGLNDLKSYVEKTSGWLETEFKNFEKRIEEQNRGRPGEPEIDIERYSDEAIELSDTRQCRCSIGLPFC